VIRVRVGDDYLGGGVAVAVTQQDQDGTGKRFLRIGPDGWREWVQLNPGESIQPTFLLDDEVAMSLMNALVSHYQGVDDQRALRKDYDDERARVDKLTNAVIDIAQKVAAS
jgi:hypothetical protein